MWVGTCGWSRGACRRREAVFLPQRIGVRRISIFVISSSLNIENIRESIKKVHLLLSHFFVGEEGGNVCYPSLYESKVRP